MVINHANRAIVENQKYTHDLSISELHFDFVKKELILEGDNYFYNKKLKFQFANVFYTEIENDDPWSRGSICQEVNSWELGNSFKMTLNENECPRSQECENVIETVFYFSSGNKLVVVCEWICLEEEDIKGVPEWLTIKRQEQFNRLFPDCTGTRISS